MAEIIKGNFGTSENLAQGESVNDFEQARALQQRLGERALAAMDGTSVFQLPTPVGEKPAETTVEKTVDNVIQFPSDERVDTPESKQVGLAAETDRTGGAAYSQETLARLQQAGVTESPADVVRQEALAAAQQESYTNAQDEIADILHGRSLEQALSDLGNDIANLQAEVSDLEQKMYFDPAMQEMHQRMVTEARAELAEMERKRAILMGGNPIALPVAEAPVVAEIEPLSDAEMAGAMDMMSPDQRTHWNVRRSAEELLDQDMADPEVMNAWRIVQEHLRKVEATELAQLRESDFATTGGENLSEVVAVQEMSENLDGAEAVLDSEQREQKVSQVAEKLRGRGGWKSVVRRVKAAVAVVLVAVTMLAGAVGSTVPTAVATETDGATRAESVQMMNERAPMSLNNIILGAEAVGDVTRDLRHEQANGTRYDYFEFASGQKNGANNFGTDKSEFYGNREGTTSALLEICRNQPETLAATVSAYPSILEACGLDGEMTAKQIDDLLSNGEDGGEIQQKLLDALEAKLTDGGTQFEFYQEYNTERSYYMYNMVSSDAEDTPANIGLQAILTKRSGEKQVKITVPVLDAEGNVVRYEAGDFNMPCGFQLNLEFAGGPETPVRTVVPPANIVPGGPEIAVPVVPITPEAPETPAPETPAPETPETPNVETPTPETPQPDTSETPQPEKPEPERPEPEKPQPEKPTPSEVVKPKDPQNQIDIVQNGGQTGNVTQTEDVRNEAPVQTEAPVVVPPGNEQVVQDNAVPDRNLSSEEQTAASEAQQEANRNEITTEPTDDEFASIVESILNEGGTGSSATGTENVQAGGAGEAQ